MASGAADGQGSGLQGREGTFPGRSGVCEARLCVQCNSGVSCCVREKETEEERKKDRVGSNVQGLQATTGNFI